MISLRNENLKIMRKTDDHVVKFDIVLELQLVLDRFVQFLTDSIDINVFEINKSDNFHAKAEI